MANNRMFIKCQVCDSEIMICKYYPQTDWYLSSVETKEDILKIENWFRKHQHDKSPSMWGSKHFELSFEIK